ncbi:MAG TPA: deoxyhypusine synthase [Rikenellaceae bacterium]|nr:deoxyhypusine synthase [Rikenellaceae bacterium]
MKPTKKDLLRETIQHIDVTKIDSTLLIDSMRNMSFSSRDTASAADILQLMINDTESTNWLILAGSTSAGGCMQVYVDMLRFNMIDSIVATGASIIDMDYFEALGYKHYRGTQFIDDTHLRDNYIDRIYDTFIDEEELQACDATIKLIADSLEPRPYSSREFIFEIGKWLSKNSIKKNSLIQTAYELNIPIFCPAFTDSSAGFGLVMHQVEKLKAGKPYLSIDSVADFRELTEVKLSAKTSGLFMIGGGVPKNFAQDTVVCAECLGFDVPMHQYAVQITVADVRDGACSSSTLKEANSWGKVNTAHEQMVYAEATTVVPVIVSYAYHKGNWKKRTRKNHTLLFKDGTKGSGIMLTENK